MHHSVESRGTFCVGAFTDLGGDYSVIRKSLLYKGLSSWRRLLVSNVNCPTVYPVLLTNTLHKKERNTGRQTLRECDRTTLTFETVYNICNNSKHFQISTPLPLHTYSDRKTVSYNYATLERNYNLSLMNESCCYRRKLHVTLTGMQDLHTHSHTVYKNTQAVEVSTYFTCPVLCASKIHKW